MAWPGLGACVPLSGVPSALDCAGPGPVAKLPLTRPPLRPQAPQREDRAGEAERPGQLAGRPGQGEGSPAGRGKGGKCRKPKARSGTHLTPQHWGSEAGGSLRAQAQPGLHGKILSPKFKTKQNEYAWHNGARVESQPLGRLRRRVGSSGPVWAVYRGSISKQKGLGKWLRGE